MPFHGISGLLVNAIDNILYKRAFKTDMTKNTVIKEGLEGLQSSNARIRDQYFYTLLAISEESPEELYHAWDIIEDILKKPEVSRKYIAVHLLSNLAAVDTENKFDRIFEEFYQLLSHESPVVSPHIAGVSGKIILSKPHLKSRIISMLLDIDSINRCRHPELLKSYVIQAFDDCFETIRIKDQMKIIKFVQDQSGSESPKTRKKAKAFLIKWKNNEIPR